MKMELDKILMDTGEDRRRYFGALVPPVIQSSLRAFESVEAFRNGIVREDEEWVYTKGTNPTVRILQEKIAALEGADACLVVGSGTAAMTLAIMSQVKQGDHVICVDDPYSWTGAALRSYLPRFGVECSFVDGTSPGNFRSAIRSNTTAIVLESPNSLTYVMQDIEAVVKLAREHDLRTIIDNSWATPLYQRPADLGVDLIVHSITKYLNGHSDVVAGCICGSKDMIRMLFYNEYMHIGPTVSPHDASLVLRGLRTFPVRMRQISRSAEQIVSYLKGRDRVSRVFYPLDPDFPQYELAKRQLTGGNGLVTFQLQAPDIGAVLQFADHLQRFKLGVSWGGPESLVLPVAALYGLEGRADPQAHWSTIRLSVGLENAEYLIADLAQAFEQLPGD